jgi:hypothetical protein
MANRNTPPKVEAKIRLPMITPTEIKSKDSHGTSVNRSLTSVKGGNVVVGNYVADFRGFFLLLLMFMMLCLTPFSFYPATF